MLTVELEIRTAGNGERRRAMGFRSRGIQERRTGSRWRPTGPPLPRPLSPAEREKGENSIALRTDSAAPAGAPPPAPPARSSRRGENSIAIPQRQRGRPSSNLPRGRHAPYLKSPPVREGGLRVVVAANSFAIAGPRSDPGDEARRAASNHPVPCPTINLPQQFWGRWASGASPEGASRHARQTLHQGVANACLCRDRTSGRGRWFRRDGNGKLS
jgi:hypothetical protein